MKKAIEARDSVQKRSSAGRLFLLFLALTALYCFWVLSLPLFPSLDGSLHLYYASVLSSLLSGSHTFTIYYFIRHILPPYSLHYYFLIAAAHFFGYVMADKMLVCLIFITTAFGFRYLAVQLGPSGDVLSLFVIALLLNWPLGMGFYNYCLAIGIAFWALGMWFRAAELRSHWRWSGFLFLVVLMILTHPIPTLLIFVLIGLDVGIRIWKSYQTSPQSGQSSSHLWTRFRWDILYMLAAWSTFLYIALFIRVDRVRDDVLQTYQRRTEILRLAKLSTLAMFSGNHPSVIAYRLSLYAVLVLGIILACRGFVRRWRNCRLRQSDLLLMCSILLFIAIPILPPAMNGANYFAQRLVVLGWLGVLAAASGCLDMSPRTRRNLVILACVDAIAVLAFANACIRPVANRLNQIESESVLRQRMVGLTLSLPDAPISNDLDYVPYYWAGARYFRRSHSILLNGGWLYESYLPLGSHVGKLSRQLTPAYQDSPGDTYRLLLRCQHARNTILPHANLLVFTGSIQMQPLLRIVNYLDQGEPSRSWKCMSHGWFSDCTSPLAK